MAVAVTTLPPLARGLPLLGSALQLGQDMHGFLREEYRRLGPIFRVKALNRTFTVIAGPEAAALLAANDGSLSTWETWEGVAKDWGGQRIITMMEGEDHSLLRKIMRNGFSKTKVYESIPLVTNVTLRELQRLPLNEPFQVLGFARRLVAEQLGLLTLGQSAGGLLADFMLFLHTELKVNFIRTSPASALQDPAFLAAKARSRAFAESVLAARRNGRIREGEYDFADDLLRASQEYPHLFSEDELLLTVLMPYLAGLDTVVSGLLLVLYDLHAHPATLARLKAEVAMAFADGVPSAEAFRRMELMHAATMESIRLRPPASLLPRVAARDFTFGGYFVPKGEGLLMALSVPLHMEEYFPQPFSYDIDRFLPPRSEHKQRGAFNPYGAGPHVCLGGGMSEVMLAVTLATMLYTCDFAIDPPGYRLRKFNERTLSPDERFMLRKVAERPLRPTWTLEGAGDGAALHVQARHGDGQFLD